jgi:hypothetical protein
LLRDRDLPYLAALLIGAYFIFMAAPGLTTRFAPDDPMNIYQYWSAGAWNVVKANLLVVTRSVRPMGGLFYLPLFAAFGFEPLAYRVAILVLLCLNLWLLYCLGRRLTGSREGGAFAALIGGYHANAAGAYLSTAVVYDVLCFSFSLGALLYYVRIRQRGRQLTWTGAIAFLALYAAALNSKEMAVIVPVAAALYEILYHGTRPVTVRRFAPLAVAAALTAIFVGVRLFGASAFSRSEAYRPSYTLSQYLLTSRTYLGMLLLDTGPASAMEVGLFWLGLVVLAVLVGRRSMWFGLGFAFAAFLPVNFIELREGFVLYIPLAGFGMYAAGLIQGLLDFVFKRPAHRVQAGALVFVLCLAGLISVQYRQSVRMDGLIRNAQRATSEILAGINRIDRNVKPGSRILFADGPFEGWDVYFMAKLHFLDPSVKIGITRAGAPGIVGDAHDRFDQVYRFERTAIRRIR